MGLQRCCCKSPANTFLKHANIPGHCGMKGVLLALYISQYFFVQTKDANNLETDLE